MLKDENLQLIDCHTHLDQYSDSDIKEIIDRCKIKGVQNIVSAGVNLSSSQKNQSLALKYPNYIWAGVGIHPMEIDSDTDQLQLDELRKLADNRETVCISEIGLDYESSSANKSLQKRFFSQQIQIACEVNKPIIFHNRGASTDPIEILNSESNGKIDIVAHYFQGTSSYTYMCLNNGFYISLAKTLLRMPKLQDLVKTEIPLERGAWLQVN